MFSFPGIAQWYSVGTGRFTQRDTLDTPLDPGNANRYTFAGNDPINYSGPLGLVYINLSGSACAMVCVELGGKYDDDPVATVRVNVGADIGAGLSLTGCAGDNEGTQVGGDCGSVTPFGGIVGEASACEGGGLGGGGGFSIGAGGGWSAGMSYTS